MLKLILMLILPIAAFLGGAAAGDFLRPAKAIADAAPAAAHNDAAEPPGAGHRKSAQDAAQMTWFQFPQQFFVPLMRNGRLDSTMVLSLSVEMPATAAESIYAQEIPLRDRLLRQLLIHANTGGFDGNFTAEPHLRALRDDLLRAVQGAAPDVTAVLIGDIARQDAS